MTKNIFRNGNKTENANDGTMEAKSRDLTTATNDSPALDGFLSVFTRRTPLSRAPYR
jgi:hypothetical protein